MDIGKDCKLCVKLLDTMSAVWNKQAHEWPPIWRKLYVVLFPIAWLIRFALVAVLLIAGGICVNLCALFRYLQSVWDGEEFDL